MKFWKKTVLWVLLGFALGVAQNYFESTLRTSIAAPPENHVVGTTLV